jgi:hypothetical protein
MTKRVLVGTALAAALIAGGATAYADTGSPTPSPTTATTVHHPKHHLLRSLPGIHGQATVKSAKTGQYVTLEWQRGTVTAMSGTTLTVTSPDGTHWTWTIAPHALTTRDDKKIAEATLKDGDTVMVVGHLQGSTNDAQRIFAPMKK